jgi:hypothetical protein
VELFQIVREDAGEAMAKKKGKKVSKPAQPPVDQHEAQAKGRLVPNHKDASVSRYHEAVREAGCFVADIDLQRTFASREQLLGEDPDPLYEAPFLDGSPCFAGLRSATVLFAGEEAIRLVLRDLVVNGPALDTAAYAIRGEPIFDKGQVATRTSECAYLAVVGLCRDIARRVVETNLDTVKLVTCCALRDPTILDDPLFRQAVIDCVHDRPVFLIARYFTDLPIPHLGAAKAEASPDE